MSDSGWKSICSFLLFPCIGVKQVFLRTDIAQKMKEINEILDEILVRNLRSTTEKSERIQSTSLINVSEVRGRDEEKNILNSADICLGQTPSQNPEMA